MVDRRMMWKAIVQQKRKGKSLCALTVAIVTIEKNHVGEGQMLIARFIRKKDILQGFAEIRSKISRPLL